MGVAATRYALVTGAGSGLGRAIALRLARQRWHVALADIDLDGASETLELVTQAGGSGQVERLDVREVHLWRELREKLESEWPRLDLLVNNAGVCAGGPVGEFPVEDWEWVLGINLHGVYYGCHVMLDWLQQNPQGAHLINVASVAAFICAPAMPSYNAAKAGVVALSETLHAELAPHRVGVSVLCPAFVPTPLLDRGRFTSQTILDSAREYMRQAQLTPEEVAEAAVAAIGTRRLYIVLGRRARTLWRIKRFFPSLFNRLIVGGYQRSLAQAERTAASAPIPQEEPTP